MVYKLITSSIALLWAVRLQISQTWRRSRFAGRSACLFNTFYCNSFPQYAQNFDSVFPSPLPHEEQYRDAKE